MHFFTNLTTNDRVRKNEKRNVVNVFPSTTNIFFVRILCVNTNIFLMQNKCMQYITWHNVLAWGFQKIKLYWVCRKAEHRVNLGGKIRKEVRRNNSKNEDDEFMFTKKPKGQMHKVLHVQWLNSNETLYILWIISYYLAIIFRPINSVLSLLH